MLDPNQSRFRQKKLHDSMAAKKLDVVGGQMAMEHQIVSQDAPIFKKVRACVLALILTLACKTLAVAAPATTASSKPEIVALHQVLLDAKHYSFIDRDGHLIPETPFVCESTLDLFESVFSEHLAAIKLNGKWGYIDTNGHEIIPAKYEAARNFHDGCAAVQENGLWGFINAKAEYVVKPQYESVTDFADGLAGVGNGQFRYNSKCGYVDTTGKLAIPLQYGNVAPFSERLARVRNRDEYDKFVDSNAKIKIDCAQYHTSAESFHNGLAVLHTPDGITYINTSGNIAFQLPGFSANDFSEGRSIVEAKDHTFMIIDEKGNRVGNEEFVAPSLVFRDDCLMRYNEGMLPIVSKDGWSGYLDLNGKHAISLSKTQTGGAFIGGIATVVDMQPVSDPKMMALRFFYIDHAGKILFTGPNLEQNRNQLPFVP